MAFLFSSVGVAGRPVQSDLKGAGGGQYRGPSLPKSFLDGPPVAMLQSGMVITRLNPLGAEVFGQDFAQASALDKDEALPAMIAERCRLAGVEVAVHDHLLSGVQNGRFHTGVRIGWNFIKGKYLLHNCSI
jgi:hypothetical protein